MEIAFEAVGEGVESRCRSNAGRRGQHEIRIDDRRPRKDYLIIVRRFVVLGRIRQYRHLRHLRTGARRRRHYDDRKRS